MDLSKAFYSLNRDLLLEKLEAYGLDNDAVSFMRSYLTSRLQRCKINSSFSKWTEKSAVVPQGSFSVRYFLIFSPMTFSYFFKIVD